LTPEVWRCDDFSIDHYRFQEVPMGRSEEAPGVRKVTSDDGQLTWFRRGQQDLRIADALDGADGVAMTVGFGRWAAGESNDWTVSYDEALVVTKGRFAIDSGGTSTLAEPGEVIYLSAGTDVVYRAEEDSEVVYVTYPHWLAATERSPHAARLGEFRPEAGVTSG
jgi:ethanolamine utilization protein EutQ